MKCASITVSLLVLFVVASTLYEEGSLVVGLLKCKFPAPHFLSLVPPPPLKLKSLPGLNGTQHAAAVLVVGPITFHTQFRGRPASKRGLSPFQSLYLVSNQICNSIGREAY